MTNLRDFLFLDIRERTHVSANSKSSRDVSKGKQKQMQHSGFDVRSSTSRSRPRYGTNYRRKAERKRALVSVCVSKVHAGMCEQTACKGVGEEFPGGQRKKDR